MTTSPKVAVVTGANKGIGFGIVKGLLKHPFDGHVYLTARDSTRGLAAVEELKKLELNAHFHQLDIDCIDSIRIFEQFIRNEYGGLDILVNNAGIAFNNESGKTSGQKAEYTIRTNYFGTLNVCRELFPLLRPNARIVNISSSLGHLPKLKGKEPESKELRDQLASPELDEERLSELMRNFVKLASLASEGSHRYVGWPDCPYKVSKVGVSALTRIQQNQFDKICPEKNILVNSVHPGYVATEMNGFTGSLTIEQGAEAPVWLALLPVKDNAAGQGQAQVLPRGDFVWHNKEIVDWVNGPTPTPY